MQTFKIALTIAIALLLQMLLPNFLQFFRYIDLPLLVTVYFALQRSPMLGMGVGIFAGIGGDIVGGGILGVGGFTKTLLGYLIAVISIKLSLENPLARLAVAALAAAANIVLIVGLNLMLEQEVSQTGSWGQFGRIIGWSALAETVTAIIVFVILDRVFSDQAQARRMAIKRRFYE